MALFFATIAVGGLLTSSYSYIVMVLTSIIVYLFTIIPKKRMIQLLQQQNEEFMTVHEELAAQGENSDSLLMNCISVRKLSDKMMKYIGLLPRVQINDGLWIGDIVTDAKTLSERGWNILGLPEKTVTTNEKWKKEMVYPEDLQRLVTELERGVSLN